jgi:hypothetical protein
MLVREPQVTLSFSPEIKSNQTTELSAMATIAMDVDLALSMMLIGSVAHLCCKL